MVTNKRLIDWIIVTIWFWEESTGVKEQERLTYVDVDKDIHMKCGDSKALEYEGFAKEKGGCLLEKNKDQEIVLFEDVSGQELFAKEVIENEQYKNAMEKLGKSFVININSACTFNVAIGGNQEIGNNSAGSEIRQMNNTQRLKHFGSGASWEDGYDWFTGRKVPEKPKYKIGQRLMVKSAGNKIGKVEFLPSKHDATYVLLLEDGRCCHAFEEQCLSV